MKVVLLHLACYLPCDTIDPGDDPPVLVWQFTKGSDDEIMVPHPSCRCGGEVIKNHVGKREPVHIPEDIHGPVHRGYTLPVKLQILPGCICGKDIQSEHINAKLFYDLFRTDYVSEAFAHLPAFRIESKSMHQDTLVW